MAIFMALHLILPALLLHSELFGFWGNEGYIDEFQQVEEDQRLELGMQFAFDMIYLILPFVLWANLCRKFFARKSGFAFSFLNTVLLTWAVWLAIDVLRGPGGEMDSGRGIGGLVFGLGLAQWLIHSPRVKAVFIR
jgi:hypothetical protein